jgi:hypothetical protein
MKLSLNLARRKQAVALVVTIVLGSIVCFLLVSYLFMVDNQDRSVARGQAWNKALVVAEAGIEEALAQLNTTGVSPASLRANLWTTNSNGGLKTNSFATDSSSYVVQIYSTSSVPTIVSTAQVPGPEGSLSLSRTVQVTCTPLSSGPTNLVGAMIVSTFVNFNGGGVNTDSFDSSNTNLFPGGYYNATNALDHGDVVSISPTNTVDLGNGLIRGTVHTPPGVTPTVGASGIVGDKAYVNNSANKGTIESNPSHALQDANYTFPDVPVPSPAGGFWYYPLAGSYKIGSVTYKYLINSSLPYLFDAAHPLDGSVYFNAPNGTVCMVKVTADTKLGSKDVIDIAGGSVNMYVDTANASIPGGIINETGLAKNFNYYGLPSNTSLSFGGNAGFVGRIYAPETTFTLSGGGTKNGLNPDFTGQSVTRSSTMSGGFNFHYDEGSSFTVTNNSSGYKVTSWKES